MNYRREIDGLRALAVVPVVLFHAGLDAFSGGFVGVDVFFVISGYLITSILIEDLDRGRFSIANFYERRIRRIFPALFLVILTCIPLAWLLMIPENLKDFSQSIGAVVIFLSNILFWKESGYFDAPAGEKPLLHTWSLAVEEQYYLFFPVLLYFLWRFGGRATLAVLISLALISLASTEWGLRHDAAANFYLLPFRIWELMAGSICAIILWRAWPRGQDVFSTVGLSMIVASIFIFDSRTPYPSFYTLLPVIGACLYILFARPDGVAGKVLGVRAFVGIGLVSYSAYLWHQPLFAFVRLGSPYEPSRVTMLSMVFLTFILAFLSWKFVEQPFRRRGANFLGRRKNIFALSAVASVVLMVVAGAGEFYSGFPGRFNPALQRVLEVRRDGWEHRKACLSEGVPKSHPIDVCLVKAGHQRIDVALVGDSHSASIAPVVQSGLAKQGLTTYSVSYGGCIGISGFFRVDRDMGHECDRYNREFLKFIDRQEIETVVLTSRFSFYLTGDRFDNGEGGVESGSQFWIDKISHREQRAAREDPERKERVLNGIKLGILELLEKVNVVLVYPIPEAGWDVVRYSLSELIRGGDSRFDISTGLATYLERNGDIIALFDGLEHPNLQKVRPEKMLCGTALPGRCVNALGDRIYYRDDNHLSNAGADLLVPEIVYAVQSLSDAAVARKQN